MLDFLRRRKQLKGLFGPYARAEDVRAMALFGDSPPAHQLRTQDINYLLVAVGGATPQDMAQRLGGVVTAAKGAGWYVGFMFSNLVVLTDGAAWPGAAASQPRALLCERVAALLGDGCKSVGGEQAGAWGEYGAQERRVFGAFLPKFLPLVAQLNQQAFGTHVDHGAAPERTKGHT